MTSSPLTRFLVILFPCKSRSFPLFHDILNDVFAQFIVYFLRFSLIRSWSGNVVLPYQFCVGGTGGLCREMRGRGSSCLPRLVHASSFPPGNRIRRICLDCGDHSRTRDARERTSCRVTLPDGVNLPEPSPITKGRWKYIPYDKPICSPLTLVSHVDRRPYPTHQS